MSQKARAALMPTNKAGNGQWQGNHHWAIQCPRGFEGPLLDMFVGWYDYADLHKDRYESLVGDDGFLGVEWEKIGDSLRDLLNGDLGRLDGGTLDAFLLNTMTTNGIDTEGK